MCVTKQPQKRYVSNSYHRVAAGILRALSYAKVFSFALTRCTEPYRVNAAHVKHTNT